MSSHLGAASEIGSGLTFTSSRISLLSSRLRLVDEPQILRTAPHDFPLAIRLPSGEAAIQSNRAVLLRQLYELSEKVHRKSRLSGCAFSSFACKDNHAVLIVRSVIATIVFISITFLSLIRELMIGNEFATAVKYTHHVCTISPSEKAKSHLKGVRRFVSFVCVQHGFCGALRQSTMA